MGVAGLGDLFSKKWDIEVNIVIPRGTSLVPFDPKKSVSSKNREEMIKLDKMPGFDKSKVYEIVKDRGRKTFKMQGQDEMILKGLKKKVRPIEDKWIYFTNKGKKVCFLFSPTGYEWYPMGINPNESEIKAIPVEMLRWAEQDFERDWERYRGGISHKRIMAEMTFFLIVAIVFILLIYIVLRDIRPVLAEAAKIAASLEALKAGGQIIEPPI